MHMRKSIARWGLATLTMAGLLAGAAGVAPSHAADEAEIYLVQGVPGETVDLEVDGKTVAENVEASSVAGPYQVPSGTRTLAVTDGEDTLVEQRMSVRAGSSWDVVVHLPAAGASRPTMTVFRNDETEVPEGKAALTVAHTARVPPADIRVDGKVLFEDVANGESLNLVVPVATYEVAIVPTGKSKPVLLGPVELTVKGGALNRVYAVGDPARKTMNVAVHVLPAAGSGSVKPDRVRTGTGGQAVGASPGVLVPLLQ